MADNEIRGEMNWSANSTFKFNVRHVVTFEREHEKVRAYARALLHVRTTTVHDTKYEVLLY